MKEMGDTAVQSRAVLDELFVYDIVAVASYTVISDYAGLPVAVMVLGDDVGGSRESKL